MTAKMLTVVILDNQERVKEILLGMLSKAGNIKIGIIKEGNIIKITERDNFKDLVSLEDKIIELEESLYNERKGRLYQSLLEAMEKPLFEHILARSEGNQFKAAKILGINRNTIRAKIRKLGINPSVYKQ